MGLFLFYNIFALYKLKYVPLYLVFKTIKTRNSSLERVILNSKNYNAPIIRGFFYFICIIKIFCIFAATFERARCNNML